MSEPHPSCGPDTSTARRSVRWFQSGVPRTTPPTLRPPEGGTAYNARADLLEVRVAERASRFCVDFKTARSPAEWSTLRAAIGQHAEYLFQTNVTDRDNHGPEVESGGAIPGQVGTSGTWTSLVVTADDSRPETLPTSFGFQAYEREPRTPGKSSLILRSNASQPLPL